MTFREWHERAEFALRHQITLRESVINPAYLLYCTTLIATMAYALFDRPPLPSRHLISESSKSNGYPTPKSLKDPCSRYHETSFTSVLHHPRRNTQIQCTVTRVSWLPRTLVPWLKYTAQVRPFLEHPKRTREDPNRTILTVRAPWNSKQFQGLFQSQR